jgi:hypothetical protein
MGVPRAVKPFGNERANAIGPRQPAHDTDLDRCDLTVEVPRGQTLTRELDTEPVNAWFVVTSRKVVWLLPEQLRFAFVPVLHRLQGRLAAQRRLRPLRF